MLYTSSFHNNKLCYNVWYCLLTFFTCVNHFYSRVEMEHLSCLWRPLLQLSKEVNIFGYCAIIGMVICFCLGVKITP